MVNTAATAFRLRPSPVAVDLLLVAGMVVIESSEWARVGLSHGFPTLVWRALVTASLAVLLLRRRYPEVVCLVLGVASGWDLVLSEEAGEGLVGTGVRLGLAIALYTLGVYRDALRAALLGTGIVAGLLLLGTLWRPLQETLFSEALLVPEAFILAPLAAGILVRLYRPAGAPTAREIELQRVSELETSRRVVLEERATIARDLHDSVAHHVNLMVIQAETGPDVVPRGGEEVLRVFRLIGDTGRRALAELDRTLALLRDGSGALLAPQPGLDDLEQLVRDTTAPGLTVELIVDGGRRPLDSGIELAAYRIVQESLTNVVKHAAAGSARVLLEFAHDGLAVQVTDRGRGFDPAAPPSGRTGHGLPGMRERARINGGTLAIASAPDAGTAVSAWLPAPAGTS